jgi:hypothetical protein
MMIEDMKLPERPPTPPSMDNILADIEKLRITVDPQFFGAKEILTHIPVHKPGMAEFVRVNPEPAMTFATVIYVDTDNQRQHYIVAPHKYAELAGETKMVTLMLAMSRQGVLFFWPLIFPNDAHSPNARIETAREGAEIAKRAWIRLKSDMTLGGYRIMQAEGEIDEPNWPVKPINELLELAFKGRVIQINLQDKFDMDQ